MIVRRPKFKNYGDLGVVEIRNDDGSLLFLLVEDFEYGVHDV